MLVGALAWRLLPKVMDHLVHTVKHYHAVVFQYIVLHHIVFQHVVSRAVGGIQHVGWLVGALWRLLPKVMDHIV